MARSPANALIGVVLLELLGIPFLVVLAGTAHLMSRSARFQ
jgi:hypothetical protein